MKRALLLVMVLSIAGLAYAQEKPIAELPVGKYETMIKHSSNKWEKGDIIILNEHQYKLSGNQEIGEYKFSTVAQRIFFTSGPLKNFFAKTSHAQNTPAIVLPAAENSQAGLSQEVWCYLRQ